MPTESAPNTRAPEGLGSQDPQEKLLYLRSLDKSRRTLVAETMAALSELDVQEKRLLIRQIMDLSLADGIAMCEQLPDGKSFLIETFCDPKFIIHHRGFGTKVVKTLEEWHREFESVGFLKTTKKNHVRFTRLSEALDVGKGMDKELIWIRDYAEHPDRARISRYRLGPLDIAQRHDIGPEKRTEDANEDAQSAVAHVTSEKMIRTLEQPHTEMARNMLERWKSLSVERLKWLPMPELDYPAYKPRYWIEDPRPMWVGSTPDEAAEAFLDAINRLSSGKKESGPTLPVFEGLKANAIDSCKKTLEQWFLKTNHVLRKEQGIYKAVFPETPPAGAEHWNSLKWDYQNARDVYLPKDAANVSMEKAVEVNGWMACPIRRDGEARLHYRYSQEFGKGQEYRDISRVIEHRGKPTFIAKKQNGDAIVSQNREVFQTTGRIEDILSLANSLIWVEVENGRKMVIRDGETIASPEGYEAVSALHSHERSKSPTFLGQKGSEIFLVIGGRERGLCTLEPGERLPTDFWMVRGSPSFILKRNDFRSERILLDGKLLPMRELLQTYLKEGPKSEGLDSRKPMRLLDLKDIDGELVLTVEQDGFSFVLFDHKLVGGEPWRYVSPIQIVDGFPMVLGLAKSELDRKREGWAGPSLSIASPALLNPSLVSMEASDRYQEAIRSFRYVKPYLRMHWTKMDYENRQRLKLQWFDLREDLKEVKIETTMTENRLLELINAVEQEDAESLRALVVESQVRPSARMLQRVVKEGTEEGEEWILRSRRAWPDPSPDIVPLMLEKLFPEVAKFEREASAILDERRRKREEKERLRRNERDEFTRGRFEYADHSFFRGENIERGPDSMTFEPAHAGFLATNYLGTVVKQRYERSEHWTTLQLPIAVEEGPMIRAKLLEVVGKEIALPTPPNGSVDTRSIRVDGNHPDTLEHTWIGHRHGHERVVFDSEYASVPKTIAYEFRQPKSALSLDAAETLEDFRGQLEDLRKEHAELFETFLDIPFEAESLLVAIRDLPPLEQWAELEAFVRGIVYYDHAKPKERRNPRSANERMQNMRRRMLEIKQGANDEERALLEGKEFAGVCADANLLLAGLLRQAGFPSGVVEGLMVNGSTADPSCQHGLAYTVWPRKGQGGKQEWSILELDGTPDGTGNAPVDVVWLSRIRAKSLGERLGHGSRERGGSRSGGGRGRGALRGEREKEEPLFSDEEVDELEKRVAHSLRPEMLETLEYAFSLARYSGLNPLEDEDYQEMLRLHRTTKRETIVTSHRRMVRELSRLLAEYAMRYARQHKELGSERERVRAGVNDIRRILHIADQSFDDTAKQAIGEVVRKVEEKLAP